ncbi:caspase recruitment domain-containing protein 19-like [Gadus chalcogrammus]|uniref:caspase recruitment domain-containing protein 19-like n=1 Tax=Gadus chalcogrammus TaxID=1042646 RepID=UPI0024C25FE3|nr:caspase recruitment domain-containing protein 19-like [Gadus chalcogrammus]
MAWEVFGDIDDYRDPLLQRDAQFLCGHQRMDTALLDRLVLQLNRIHPQILNDHEAQRFRNLAAATRGRLSGLLEHLQQEGDEACLGFYQALQLHAEDLYCTLPSRVSLREMAEPKKTNTLTVQERSVLNHKGKTQ